LIRVSRWDANRFNRCFFTSRMITLSVIVEMKNSYFRKSSKLEILVQLASDQHPLRPDLWLFFGRYLNNSVGG
jgi:hypothetical protein